MQPGLVDLFAFAWSFHYTDNTGMPIIQLTPAQRKEHRAEAHHLDPVVLVGGDGLTANVKKEIDAALNAHGLIKVRVFSDDRVARETMFQSLADELNAAPYPAHWKIAGAVAPQGRKRAYAGRRPYAGPRDFKVLKYSKRAGQRPEVKTLRVLGNQRLTAGGNVKRAKPKPPVSVKKRSQT
jgi:RNA-binding protein